MKTKYFILASAILMSGSAIFAQKVEVNTKKSSVEWLGKKIGRQHEGNIQLKSGSFELQDDQIVAGNFVVDMTTIKNTDLENEKADNYCVEYKRTQTVCAIVKFRNKVEK